MSGDYRQSHTRQGYGRSYDEEFRRNPHRAVVWDLEKRALDAIVRDRLAGREIRLLDFACGSGRIMAHLRDRVARVVGVDVSPSMLEIARERVPGAEIVEADLTRDDVLGDATFDLITAFRFFPNAQPDLRRDAMAALVRHLDRDGLLVFNNHENASSLLYRLSRLSGRGGRRGMARAEVDDLVAAAGLEIVGTRAIALLPLTERHPILPRPLLRAVEGAASRCALFKGLYQDLVFTCAHAAPAATRD